MLPAPGFHHLHLNSVDPDAAIDFYTRQFPSTSTASWGGLPALASPNNVLVLFSKVATPPATAPQTAIWHFGWHVTDTRKRSTPTRAGRTSSCCRSTPRTRAAPFRSAATPGRAPAACWA